LTGAVVNELAGRFGRELVEEAIVAAGLDSEYLADGSRWISAKFMARLSDEVVRRVFGEGVVPDYDDPFWQIWRRSVRAFAAEMTGSLLWLYLWSLQSPSAYFADIEQHYRTHNTITRARLVAQGPGWSTIETTELRPEDGRPAACWTRVGLFEALPEVWGLPPGRVEHEVCCYRAHDVPRCVYTIHYGETSAIEPRAALAAIAARMRTSVPQISARQAQYYREQRLTLLAQRKIAHYLPPTLLGRVEANPEEELALGGRRCEGAVLFADVQGFTRRCNGAPPESVVDQLNLYFEYMDEVVAAHGGIVDKRIGDGMMVVFVDVDRASPREALAVQALRCGLGMLRSLQACNVELAAAGVEPLVIRVGVAAGSLVHGNIGSRERMEYTVIGEPVNLAARLEAAAGPDRLLTLPEFAALVPEVRGAPRTIEAKGFGSVQAFELDPA
jgi:class 3 adenylate cyclase